ncbi:hypothetical protein ETI08_03610 [Macrococcoides goetzii]|nr:hypothetical protein [Macrococcus goetzii]TDM48238.1 hypothetical protein ETI08_03610 [Macrococcus goetzii]
MNRNTLGDLNGYLFEQMERLNNPELTNEELKVEFERSKAITELGKTIVSNANVVLSAQKMFDGRMDANTKIPGMLEG